MPLQPGEFTPAVRACLVLPKFRGAGLFDFMAEKIKSLFLSVAIFVLAASFGQAAEKSANVGVYYFDGWAGKNTFASNPAHVWAKGAPSHLSKKLATDFSGREPLWGWRDDSQEIMDRQIELAAENGVSFFLFCWYWRDNNGPINQKAIESDPLHTSLHLYLKSKNKNSLKYCLLVANHAGAEIKGDENWAEAVKYWTKYFSDPQYMRVDGKPLVIIFSGGQKSISDKQIEIMRQTAKSLGFEKGIAIAGCNAPSRPFDISTFYNIVPGYNTGKSRERPYGDLISATKATWNSTHKKPFIPVVTCGWDKRPWEGKSPEGLWNTPLGDFYTGDTPQVFGKFFSDAVKWVNENPDKTVPEKIVLVYAWNELGEGGYLVPTKADPSAKKLKEIKKAVFK